MIFGFKDHIRRAQRKFVSTGEKLKKKEEK